LETKEYDFHLLDGNSVKVPFITSTHNQFISVFDGFKVLGLPYKHGNKFISRFDADIKDKRQFSMYFFLPDTKDGLSFLIKKLAYESKFLERMLPSEKVKVGNFTIPKFKISFELETSNVLKELGVDLPFNSGSLTKMVESPASQDLYVHKIFHKSFINVNEDGTKAAAASAATKRLCFRPHRLDFVADHPFLFLIREDSTGTILFVGQVVNPLIG
jgi:serpin B